MILNKLINWAINNDAQKKKAYVFNLDSSINPLVKNGIIRSIAILFSTSKECARDWTFINQEAKYNRKNRIETNSKGLYWSFPLPLKTKINQNIVIVIADKVANLGNKIKALNKTQRLICKSLGISNEF